MASKNQTVIIAEPDKQEVLITREFEAPVALVFKAHTDPKFYAQWLGPRAFSTRIVMFNVETGGAYQYAQIDQEGNEYMFRGVYHEVIPLEKIINTFEWLDKQGGVHLETTLFEALPDNRTRLHTQAVFRSVEARDGMVKGGMEYGIVEAYEQLDELL